MSNACTRTIHAAALLATLLAACSRAPAPTDPGQRVLARIGSETVTAADFEHAMRRRGGDVPEVFTNMANRRALLDEVTRAETLAAAARQGGYFDRPEVRQAAQRQAVQLFQEAVRSAVPAPTDADVAARYAEHRADYQQPARVRFAVIRLARPAAPDQQDVMRQRAGQARAEALALTNEIHFGGVATAYSDDLVTRYKGGDVGWVRETGEETRFPTGVLAAARGPVGAVSEIVEAADAFYLVKVMDRSAAEPIPLATVGENIRIALRREREQRALDAALVGHPVKVWVDEQLLAALPVPPPPPGAEKRRGPPVRPTD